MCLISSIKVYLHEAVFSRFFSSWLSKKFYLLYLVLGQSFLFAQIQQSYSFSWDTNQSSFSNNGEIFPTLNLFENCFYLFEASGAEFTITEANGSIFVGDELFGNKVMRYRFVKTSTNKQLLCVLSPQTAHSEACWWRTPTRVDFFITPLV